ncbi:MAG: hypothetical protein Q9205_003486 [Flavoplaca limonia]
MASIQDVNEAFKISRPGNPDEDTLINALRTRKPVSVAPYDRVDRVKLLAAVACILEGGGTSNGRQSYSRQVTEFAHNPLFFPVAQLGIALYIINAGVGDALALIGDSRFGLQHDLRYFRIDQKKASEETEKRLCDKIVKSESSVKTDLQNMEARIHTSIQDFSLEISKSFQQAREDTRKDRKDLQEANYAAHKAPKDDIERLLRVAGKDAAKDFVTFERDLNTGVILVKIFKRSAIDFFENHDATLVENLIVHPFYCAKGMTFDNRRVPETNRSPRVPRARGAISPPPQPQTAKGAVVAHNYPYFGGSYDNSIVLRCVKKLLEQGFIVGTFNYRGVGQSGGRSTSTSKAELQDHISFVGFFIHYLSEIYYKTACVGSPHNASGWTPITGGYVVNGPSIHLVIAGYCYGALMTRHLPDIPTILDQFSKVLTTSTQAEIRGRANRLASITVGYLRDPEYLRLIQNFTSSSRRMLEEEAMEYLEDLKKPFTRKKARDSQPNQGLGEEYTESAELPKLKIIYILISVLLGPAASLVTGFRKLGVPDGKKLDGKFRSNPTFIVHGGLDKITAASRLRGWVKDIYRIDDTMCQLVGDEAAGHSWKESGMMEVLEKMLADILVEYASDRQLVPKTITEVEGLPKSDEDVAKAAEGHKAALAAITSYEKMRRSRQVENERPVSEGNRSNQLQKSGLYDS